MDVKNKSLRRTFTVFILKVFFEIVFSFVVIMAVFFMLVNTGFFRPPTYYESYVQDVIDLINKMDDYVGILEKLDVQLGYYITDKKGIIVNSDNERHIGEDINKVLKTSFFLSNIRYYKVEKNDVDIYLECYFRVSYGSNFLNRYFVQPYVVTIIIVGIVIFFIIFTNVRRLEKMFNRELEPLGTAAESISLNNIDVSIEHSNIIEIEKIVNSFEKMRNELEQSLSREWTAQKERREQIALLAHDLKTPLTVILGNLDLLAETKLDDGQSVMIETAIKEVERSEDYIGVLVDMVKNSDMLKVNREEIVLEDFFGEIRNKANIICCAIKVELITVFDFKESVYVGDKTRIERAIMNIISNSVDYSKEGGKVELAASSFDGHIEISVSDEGPGFPDSIIKNGAQLFMMGEKSRSSRKHYGIGLYMADATAKAHFGRLELLNKNECGAIVKMFLN